MQQCPYKALCRCDRRFCSCAVDETQRKELRPLQLGYYEKLQQLIGESGRYDDKDDFSVVLQPMFRDLKMPTDVFHRFAFTLFILYLLRAMSNETHMYLATVYRLVFAVINFHITVIFRYIQLKIKKIISK